MQNYQWKATAFLSHTSSKPLMYVIIGISSLLLGGVIVASQYMVDSRVVVYGEVISQKGDRDVTASISGVIDLVDLKLGQNVKEGDVIGLVKMQFTNQERVDEILQRLHSLFGEISAAQDTSSTVWPELASENPMISELLQKSRQSFEDYNNEIIVKRRLTDLKIKNLLSNKNLLQKRLKVLEKSKTRSLTESLIEEQKREIATITEELAKLNNENQTKASEIKSRLLAELKSSYLRIHEYRESHIVKSFAPGRISKIYVSSSQQIQKDQPLIVLSPLDEEFELRLRVPTFQAGKIESQLQVHAEIDAFPYQKFGMFQGKIIRIDQIVTRSDDETFFNAYASVYPPRQNNRSMASTIQLLPGMRVKSHIIIKRLTILQLLYENLFLRHENP